MHPDKQTNQILYDKQFIEICKDIGFAPKYQYQLLSLILKVDKNIMEEANKEKLNTSKKIMVTHSKLRQYPELQKD